MKFLRFSNVYSEYWKQFYIKNRGLHKKTFEQQLKTILCDFFGTEGCYSYYLSKKGYECKDFIANIIPLQISWCRENRFKFDRNNFIFKNSIEYAKIFEPEILFLNDFTHFNSKFIKEIKEKVPSIKLVVGWCSSPIKDIGLIKNYDIIFTSSKYFYQKFKSLDLHVEYLPHAFDTRILNYIKNQEKEKTITFAGTITQGSLRYDFIKEVITKIPINIYTGTFEKNLLKLLFKKLFYRIKSKYDIRLLNKLLKRIEENDPIIWYYDPIYRIAKRPVYGLEMYKILAKSLISLNLHQENIGDYTGAARIFEVTGVGSCLLTDWKNDIGEFFNINKEIVVYKSINECMEQAIYLIDNPNLANIIGKNGQERTIKNHTYECRVKILDELLVRHIRKNKY